MWELSGLWCYIVDSPGRNPATNIKSCLFVQRSDIGITFHCEQIKCRNAQSGLRIRHIKCRNTQSLHSAHSRSSVAIHNLFTAHTADQVSQYTISSQRTRQINCRNTQSLHSAHSISSVAIHNLRTAHMVGAAFLRIYGDECLVFIATYCIPWVALVCITRKQQLKKVSQF